MPITSDKRYICQCGNDAFRIFEDYIECAKCGLKYDDTSQPTPEDFNAGESYLLEAGQVRT